MILQVMFLPKSQLYKYTADFPAEVGDLVAVPPNYMRSEGTVAVVKGVSKTPTYKGELKAAWRVIPRSEWPLHGYDPE
jgi:hypothetical protein